jgi:hypothetical protein
MSRKEGGEGGKKNIIVSMAEKWRETVDFTCGVLDHLEGGVL